MTRKLDPNLASILDSIRATVGGEQAPAPAETDGPAPPPAAPAPRALPAPQHTVEEFLAELIRPQVAAWLDQHLPEIVQTLAQQEIERLTGNR